MESIKNHLKFIVLLILSLQDTQASPVELGSTGKYYEYINSVISWDQAKINSYNSVFNGAHGRLVIIQNSTENEFVTNLVANNGGQSTWLNASNTVTGNTQNWTWGNGSTFSCPILGSCTGGYTNFALGEPNNDGGAYGGSNEAALQLYAITNLNGGYYGGNQAGQWNDLAPYGSYAQPGYVIEYVTSPVPVPASFWLLTSGIVSLFGLNRKKKSV